MERKKKGLSSVLHKQNPSTLPPLPTVHDYTDRREVVFRKGKTRSAKEQKEFQKWGDQMYEGRSAATGLRHKLHAMHVKALKDQGPHDPRNCILIEDFLNTAWDAKQWTMTDEYVVLVAPHMMDVLGAFNGKRLMFPQPESHWPKPEWVREHRVACLSFWAEFSTNGGNA